MKGTIFLCTRNDVWITTHDSIVYAKSDTEHTFVLQQNVDFDHEHLYTLCISDNPDIVVPDVIHAMSTTCDMYGIEIIHLVSGKIQTKYVLFVDDFA